MDQDKIGEFIAACRKEKGLTQSQVAERFGISNRAVSKWETGKSLPDVSIMLDLCDLLGITVNELLSAERVSMEDSKEKAENTLLEMQENLAASETKYRFTAILGILFGVIMNTVRGTVLKDKLGTFDTPVDFVLGIVLSAVFACFGCLLGYAIDKKMSKGCSGKSRVGLWVCWILLLIAEAYLKIAEGINSSTILLTFRMNEPTGFWVLFAGWMLFIVKAAMLIITIRSYSLYPVEWTKGRQTKTVFAAAVFLLLWIPALFVTSWQERFFENAAILNVLSLLNLLKGFLLIPLFVVICVNVIAFLKSRNSKCDAQWQNQEA